MAWCWWAGAIRAEDIAIEALRGPVVHAEYLEYDIRWGILSVGHADMSHVVHEAGADGVRVVVDRMSARSHGWVSIVRKIDNVIESTRWEREGTLLRSRVVKKLRQGRFHQDDVLLVDGEARRATWENRLRGRTYTYEIPAGVKDYVSLIFDLREMAWTGDATSSRHHLVLDRAVHDMEVTRVATGLVKSAMGRLPAVRLSITSNSRSLFTHNKPGDVWISADQAVLLSMEAKTPVGDVRTSLRTWTINGKDAMDRLKPSAK